MRPWPLDPLRCRRCDPWRLYAFRVNQGLVIGNSDGIGRALTVRLLDERWSVTGVSRRDSGIEHEHYAHRTVDVTART